MVNQTMQQFYTTSALIPHKSQRYKNLFPSPQNKNNNITCPSPKLPRLRKFAILRILSCNSFQKNTTTLEGDELFQMRGPIRLGLIL